VSLAIIAVIVISIVALIGGGYIGGSSTWAEAAPVVDSIMKKTRDRAIAHTRKNTARGAAPIEKDRPLLAELTAIAGEGEAAVLAVVRKLPPLAFENHCDELFAIVEVGKPTKFSDGRLGIPISIEPKRELEIDQFGFKIRLLVESYDESNTVLDSHRQGLIVGETERLLPDRRYQVVLEVPWNYGDLAKSNLHHASVRLSREKF